MAGDAWRPFFSDQPNPCCRQPANQPASAPFFVPGPVEKGLLQPAGRGSAIYTGGARIARGGKGASHAGGSRQGTRMGGPCNARIGGGSRGFPLRSSAPGGRIPSCCCLKIHRHHRKATRWLCRASGPARQGLLLAPAHVKRGGRAEALKKRSPSLLPWQPRNTGHQLGRMNDPKGRALCPALSLAHHALWFFCSLVNRPRGLHFAEKQ